MSVTVGWTPFAVAHLSLAGIWLGAMVYSLGVVQPKVARFFVDEVRREEFLITLAQGNRWPVVALVSGLILSAIAIVVTGPRAVAIGYAVALGLYLAAALVFVDVSWRHWPARVFARPDELPGYHRRLRLRARTMLVLVGTAFLLALTVSVAA